MIKQLNSDHSVTIKGSKEELDNLKRKIANLLGINGPIGDNLFIELQSVFKALRNEQGQPYTISVEEAFKRQNKKVEYTDNCKHFLSILGNKDEQQIELPKPPIGELSFEDVKSRFGFERDPKATRWYYINVPAELAETLKIVKKYYQPNEKENRFSIKEDKENPNSIIYNFEIASKDKIKLRRYVSDTDDEHFIFTALRLLCFYQSKNAGPILNLFKVRAANYLLNCLPSPTNLPLNKIPEFHCEFIDVDYGIPPIELFFKNPVRISVYQATFLIEIFCEIQESINKCSFDKPYLSHKHIYLLSILSPLPVAFEYISSDLNVELTFADTSIASADFIFNQVKFAMGIFSNLSQFYASFDNVDSLYWSSEKFITVYDRLGFSIVRGTDKNPTGKAATFEVWSILSKPEGSDGFQAQKDSIEHECSEIFDEIKLYKCDQCDQWFSHGFGGECSFCEHTGVRAPFPDTNEMEKIEYVKEGNQLIPVKSVYYTCCGEKPENAPGCSEMVFPFGHKERVDDKGNQVSCSFYRCQLNSPEK